MRIVRFLLGLLLIPFCLAASWTMADLVRVIQPSAVSVIPAAAWALAGGFVFWLFLYSTLPRPVRSYVLAHELTHALWGWLMGARVSKLKVSREKGSVTLSKTNLLITLAPYFFPLYTVVVIVVYGALSLRFAVEPYVLLWLGLVGFTWGFHFTFTLSTLMQQQSDIQAYGRLFSYAWIYVLNALGVCFWIVAVSDATLEQMITFMSRRSTSLCAMLAEGFRLIAG